MGHRYEEVMSHYYIVYEVNMIVEGHYGNACTSLKHGECLELPSDVFTELGIRALEKRLKEGFLKQKEVVDKGLKDCYVTVINWIELDKKNKRGMKNVRRKSKDS